MLFFFLFFFPIPTASALFTDQWATHTSMHNQRCDDVVNNFYHLSIIIITVTYFCFLCFQYLKKTAIFTIRLIIWRTRSSRITHSKSELSKLHHSSYTHTHTYTDIRWSARQEYLTAMNFSFPSRLKNDPLISYL